MTSKIDQVSLMLGEMKATQAGINDKVIQIATDTKANQAEIECIKEAVVNQKVRTAYLAGGISVFSTAGLLSIKYKLGDWLHKLGL